MAEARIAVSEPRVCKVIDQEIVSGDATLKAYLKGGLRRYYRTRNTIRNGMWPTSVSNLCLACSLFFVVIIVDPLILNSITGRMWKLGDSLYIPQSFPVFLRAAIISCIVGITSMIVLMHVRQCLLRILLSYREWMYSPMRKPPMRILIWGLIVRLLSGYQPSLYSFQRSLPRMSVPSLKDTLAKLYESLKPVCTDEELAMFKKQGKEFITTVGPKLQKLLVLKSWITPNYVTDWWEKYIYLRNRSPLSINCNYYVLDQSFWKGTEKPASRSAALLYNVLRFKRLVDREELTPLLLRNTIPICMSQYERMFSTTRIPGEDMDELVHYSTTESKHIVVVCKGVYYKLEVYDADNQCLCAKTLETQFQWIMEDSSKHSDTLSAEEQSLSALTGLERSQWAKIRKKYLFNGVNSETREVIEKAICCLWIVDAAPETLTERGKWIFHGDAKSFWFDKCFNIIVFANGKCGLNCEHSLADAPAYAHMWEYALCKDVLECTFDEEGAVFPPNKTFQQAPVRRPIRLIWEVNEELSLSIRNAVKFLSNSIEDVDLIVLDHNNWGKGEMKRSQISPDAFVQIALQMSYYKDAGKFVQTYEASMTRLYLNGRTETVRSCTQEAVDFVLALAKNNVPREEKIKLLKKAANRHTDLYKDAMNGKGIDRHLFALYVACKGLGYESEFLSSVLTRPWTLSTSQTPHTQQTAVPDPNWKSFKDKLSPGGGFGPVSDEGYGVSYMFPNDNRIFFHISSKKSCNGTDSSRFGRHLFASLEEIRSLFEEASPS